MREQSEKALKDAIEALGEIVNSVRK